jgi:hypothetical protein
VRLVDMSSFDGAVARLRLGGADGQDIVSVSAPTASYEVRCVSPRVLFNGTLEMETGDWTLRLEATGLQDGHNLDMRRAS